MVRLQVFEAAVITSLLSLQAVAVRFNPLHHSGAASPYFDAPSQEGIPHDTPSGCVVDQAAYIVRHGARFPEPGSFGGWQSLFKKIQNATFTASGALEFLGSWVPPVDDVPHEPLFLTSTGSLESFKLGVKLRKRYGFTPGGHNLTVWSAAQQRVIDTATYFLRGYLSQGSYLGNTTANRGIIISLPDSVNYTYAESLTTSVSCKLYPSGDKSSFAGQYRAKYQPKVAARLNEFLNGLVLNASDVSVMQDLCGFQAVLNGDLRFCDVFEDSEWLDYEYAHDLNYYYGSGPGNQFSGATGFPWVKAITDLFQIGPNAIIPNATISPSPLIMSMTHDNNITPIIAALGLWNDSLVSPLDVNLPDPDRLFHSSDLVSFRGYVALERISCEMDDQQSNVTHMANVVNPTLGRGQQASHYVRVRANDAPISIPGCASGPGSTCPLDDFVEYVTKRGEIVGDFVTTCGLQNVSNATNTATFFTNPPVFAQTFTAV